MSLAPAKPGRVNGDPVGSEKPRGKDASERRSRYDPGWTPTELHRRARLLKQFCKLEGPAGNSDAYLSAPCWCACGRGLKAEGHEKCGRCLASDSRDLEHEAYALR